MTSVPATMEVLRAGALTTLQDAGRPGMAHLALARSGSLDPGARRLANRLVGNVEDQAVLETTLDGVALRVSADRYVAVTGAPCDVLRDGVPQGHSMPFLLRARQVLDVGSATSGVRSYVAVGGGIVAEPVLGSVSWDSLSRTGRPPLRRGERLTLGAASRGPAPVDFMPLAVPERHSSLRLVLGPRHDWLTERALVLLATEPWSITSESDRVGIRLEGPHLELSHGGELVSEGIAQGALQVPPDGRPILFLADHPTTGGYPVVGSVVQADMAKLAQARPGTTVSFEPFVPTWARRLMSVAARRAE